MIEAYNMARPFQRSGTSTHEGMGRKRTRTASTSAQTHLPVDSVEEPDEIVVRWAKPAAELGGELLDETGDELHVIPHGRSQVFHDARDRSEDGRRISNENRKSGRTMQKL